MHIQKNLLQVLYAAIPILIAAIIVFYISPTKERTEENTPETSFSQKTRLDSIEIKLDKLILEVQKLDSHRNSMDTIN